MQRPYFQEFEERAMFFSPPLPFWILQPSKWKNYLFHPLCFSDKVSRHAFAILKCSALVGLGTIMLGKKTTTTTLFESHSNLSLSPHLFHGVSIPPVAPRSLLRCITRL